MSGSEALWQRALRRADGLVATGHPADERRLVQLYIELYAVGEHPSPGALRAFLAQLWPGQPSMDRNRAVALWRRVLENPRRDFRCLRHGSAWARPFLFLDEICAAHDIEGVDERLARQVEDAARAFRSQLEGPFQLEAVEAAAATLESRVFALLIWGAAQDSDGRGRLPAHLLLRRRTARSVFSLTRSGQAREAARLARARERDEWRFPPRGGPA